MVSETTTTEQTWRCLWSHAAYVIMSSFPSTASYQPIQAGAGWGLCSRTDQRRALLLHPSGSGREVGDLSLTIPGYGTQVLPRCSYSYPEYLDRVTDIIETTLSAYVERDPAVALRDA